jgi:hypothetical protein
MAHRGPLPKSNKLGMTPNAEWTEVPNRPYEGASPELPKLPNRRKYHELVVTWWEMVRHMPHCVNWGPTDWQYAVETAMLKNFFWVDALSPDPDVKITAAQEIRRREDNMGTTVEALRKLRIRYVDVDMYDEEEEEVDDPNAPQPEVRHQRVAGGARPVTSLASRRARAMQDSA